MKKILIISAVLMTAGTLSSSPTAARNQSPPPKKWAAWDPGRYHSPTEFQRYLREKQSHYQAQARGYKEPATKLQADLRQARGNTPANNQALLEPKSINLDSGLVKYRTLTELGSTKVAANLALQLDREKLNVKKIDKKIKDIQNQTKRVDKNLNGNLDKQIRTAFYVRGKITEPMRESYRAFLQEKLNTLAAEKSYYEQRRQKLTPVAQKPTLAASTPTPVAILPSETLDTPVAVEPAPVAEEVSANAPPPVYYVQDTPESEYAAPQSLGASAGGAAAAW